MWWIISTIKSNRTRNLRYKHPALASLGFADILEELYNIMDTCSDVQWFVDQDDDTLLNALDGDDEAEWEFRMAFADLSAKSEQLYDMIQGNIDYQTFDDCIVSLIGNGYISKKSKKKEQISQNQGMNCSPGRNGFWAYLYIKDRFPSGINHSRTFWMWNHCAATIPRN